MKFRDIAPFLRISGVSLAIGGSAFSQTTLGEFVARTNTEMDAGRWEQALDLGNRAVASFGEDAWRKYGPQFGAVYYRKGLCEMKLKRWSAAMESFEICYRDYRNTGAARDNPFQNLAILKWGEAAMGAESWELAASRFEKFLDERDRVHDSFARGAFYINLAICQYKLGRINEGNENAEIAMSNKFDFPTPDEGIVAAFEALAEAVMAVRNPQALLDFIAKNRGDLVVDSGVFLRLAGDAVENGMPRVALALYQFVPSVEADPMNAASPDIVKLAGVAVIHERAGNPRGAFAAYQQLVRYFPAAAGREEHFHNLIRTGSLIGEGDLTRFYAGAFAKEFPNSPHLAELRASGIDATPAEVLPAPKIPEAGAGEVPLPQDRKFREAMDLYEGRRYHDARVAFAAIKAKKGKGAGDMAAFYETECLRKLGDLEGLGRELKALGRLQALGARRMRQLEIDGIWEAVRVKDWGGVARLAKDRNDEPLPGDQRAQIAFCQGLADMNTSRRGEALLAFNIAMTADAGASEELASQAAVLVLQILKMDPEVQSTMERWGNTTLHDGPDFAKLREATAVAGLFELSLGAGAALPDELKDFLKYQEPRK